MSVLAPSALQHAAPGTKMRGMKRRRAMHWVLYEGWTA
jgi:hypothetical protein